MLRSLIVISALAILIALPAAAQQQPAYVPPDAELWEIMTKALSEVAAPLAAHQQIQRIVSDVQRAARERAAAAAPKPSAFPKKDD